MTSKLPKSITFDQLLQQKGATCGQNCIQIHQKRPTWSQKKPKWNESCTQSDPKGAKKGPKWSAKGAKREPNGDQNALKTRFSEKVSSRERSVVRWCHSGGAVLADGVAPGVDFGIDPKIDAEKVMKKK